MKLGRSSRDVRATGRSTRESSWLLSITFASALLISGTNAQLNNLTSPTHSFKSRPDLHAPILDFAILKPASVTPGYIFLAPYRNLDPGPYIYDNAGQLVWSGAGSSGTRNAHAPQVCKYKGKDHLCYFEGRQHQGFARGHGVIMDQNYRVVKTIESAGAGASSDMHEFRETPYSDGSTLLTTVYQPQPYDLSTNPRFNIWGGVGWIVEGIFREIEIDTGRVLFEWRSLDHVDPGDSWTMPGTTDTSGTGLTEQSPWDYFHLDSVDKNVDGDYLISARHTSAVYKISGADGHVIWQLGGNRPTIESSGARFAFQHDARFVSENSTHTVISLFDNAGNMWNQTEKFSHGKIIEIDLARQSAATIKQWGLPDPTGGLLTTSQGNLQLLPDGNCHIGWGAHAYFSEHTSSGDTVMYARLAHPTSNVMNYRSHKFNWTGTPLTKPALYTYSLNGTDQMGLWVSWNGATEVRGWNFFVSHGGPQGPFEIVAPRVPKSGFETELFVPTAAPWAYAEALGADDRVLERSALARTFVPGPSLRPHCDERGCRPAQRVPREYETPYDAAVELDPLSLSPNRGFATDRYYAASPEDVLAAAEAMAAAAGSASSSSSTTKGSSDSYPFVRQMLGGKGDADAGSFRFGLGLVLGFAGALFASVLWNSGRLRRIQLLAQRLRARVAGPGGSNRYTRVYDKELASGGSSRSSIVY